MFNVDKILHSDKNAPHTIVTSGVEENAATYKEAVERAKAILVEKGLDIVYIGCANGMDCVATVERA